MLDRTAVTAGVEKHLSSHSFRGGGAEHAKSPSALTVQWIFDWVAWNMSTASRAFTYVFNTQVRMPELRAFSAGVALTKRRS